MKSHNSNSLISKSITGWIKIHLTLNMLGTSCPPPAPPHQISVNVTMTSPLFLLFLKKNSKNSQIRAYLEIPWVSQFRSLGPSQVENSNLFSSFTVVFKFFTLYQLRFLSILNIFICFCGRKNELVSMFFVDDTRKKREKPCFSGRVHTMGNLFFPY